MKQTVLLRSLLISSIILTFDSLGLYAIFRLSIFIRQISAPLFSLAPLIYRKVFWNIADPLIQLGIIFSIAVFFIQGLYPGFGLTAIKELERVGKSVSLAFFLLAGVSYLNKSFQEFPRSILFISWLIALVALPLGRFILRNILSRFDWYGVPVLIYGEGKLAKETARKMRQVRRLGWIPAKILPLSGMDEEDGGKYDAALIASASLKEGAKKARLLSGRFRRVILTWTEDSLGTLWVESRDLEGQLALDFEYHLLHPETRLVKRMIDLIGAFFLLVLFSPFFLLLALAIALDSRGPVFFRQHRLGQNSKQFDVLKFRTMRVNAEEQLSEILKNDSYARTQYERFHKLEDDPRVTRVGRWLRKYSLDELPQLINVIKGEMSLTGPRAYMPSELGEMGEFAIVILRVRPGMTGWWQISGRHQTAFRRRLEMDNYYISNWSLWMDFYILLKTGLVVILGKGA